MCRTRRIGLKKNGQFNCQGLMKFFTEQKTVVDHPGNDNKEKFTYVSHKPVHECVYIHVLNPIMLLVFVLWSCIFINLMFQAVHCNAQNNRHSNKTRIAKM